MCLVDMNSKNVKSNGPEDTGYLSSSPSPDSPQHSPPYLPHGWLALDYSWSVFFLLPLHKLPTQVSIGAVKSTSL